MRNYLILITLFISNLTCAQAWQWGKNEGSTHEDAGNIIKIDNQDNIYVGSSSLGQGTYYYSGQDSFLVNGLDDIFISKYNSTGQIQWTKQFGGFNPAIWVVFHENIFDMLIDTVSNHLYIYGVFAGTAIFGNDTLSTPANQARMFLSKLDFNGNCIWTRSFGSPSYNVPGALSISTSGNIFLTGAVSPIGYFDTLYINPGGFLAEFTSQGDMLFVKKIFSPTNNSMASVMQTSIKFRNDSLYIIGNNVVDSLTIDTTTFIADGIGIVISCFDTTGVLSWAKFSGSPLFGIPGAQPIMDKNGDLVMTGVFGSGISYFDGDTFVTTSTIEMFIAKYDRNGNKIWAKQMKSDNSTICGHASFDSSSNLYVVGSFKGTTIFGADTLTAVSIEDLFVLRIDTGGNSINVIQIGDAIGHGITTNTTGSFYVTGIFSNPVSFGSSSLTSFGTTDVFVAKYDFVTNIEENDRVSQSDQLTIYSNPSKGSFKINLPDAVTANQNLNLIVTDNLGRRVADFSVNSKDENRSYNIEAAAGFYSVSLIGENVFYTGKLVLEK